MALLPAVAGVAVLTEVRLSCRPLGFVFAFANCLGFMVYVVLGHRIANARTGGPDAVESPMGGIDRLGVSMPVAAVVATPDRHRPGSTSTRGPAVVGNIGVVLARYGVADVGMALLDSWRRQGLGTALLDAGVGWAQAAGAHKVALEVWPDNAPALALYRRAGFVEEGRKRRHYRRANGELWDAILMGRHLS